MKNQLYRETKKKESQPLTTWGKRACMCIVSRVEDDDDDDDDDADRLLLCAVRVKRPHAVFAPRARATPGSISLQSLYII